MDKFKTKEKIFNILNDNLMRLVKVSGIEPRIQEIIYNAVSTFSYGELSEIKSMIRPGKVLHD